MTKQILFGLSILMVVMSACEKPKNLIYNGGRIRIDSIRPLFVKEGQSFTIYGKNFNPVAAKNILTINNIPAQGNVMEGRIQVTLPTGVFRNADTLLAQLTLKEEGEAYVDTAYFYSSQTPRIYSVAPTTVRIGDTITVKGEGFVEGRDERAFRFMPPVNEWEHMRGDQILEGKVPFISDRIVEIIVPEKAKTGVLGLFTSLPVFIPGLSLIHI